MKPSDDAKPLHERCVIEHHKGHKSVDHQWVFAWLTAQARQGLKEMMRENPESKTYAWPCEDSAVIGFVRH